MNDKDFLDTLASKVGELEAAKKETLDNLMNSGWHAQQVDTALKNALAQASELEGQDHVDALTSIIQQVPGFIHGIWNTMVTRIKGIEDETARWREMKKLYENFLEGEKVVENDESAGFRRVDDLTKSIASGDVKEPSKMTGIRRPVGSRPPTTLKEYRNLSKEMAVEQTNSSDDPEG